MFRKTKKTNESTKNTSTKENQNQAEKKESKRDAKKRIQRERNAQNVLAYTHICEDGIIALRDDVYSKAIRFNDINYMIATDKEKDGIIYQYKNLLNSVGNDVDVSLVINNRALCKDEFEEKVIMKHRGDGLDVIRAEMNTHLMKNMEKGNNSIVSEKMFIFSCKDSNYLEAKKTLDNLEKDFSNQLYSLGCEPKPMLGIDRVKTLSSILKPGKTCDFSYDMLNVGESTKDYITPYSFHFKKDHFEMGDRFCSVMILSQYPTNFGDRLIYDLSQIKANLVISFHMQLKSVDEAMSMVNKARMFIEAEEDTENDRANKKGKLLTTLPHHIEVQKKSIEQWTNALTELDERIFQTQFLVMVNASTLDELNEIKKDVERIGKRSGCEFLTMDYEQEMGFNAALPLGIPKQGLGRNLLTDNCANVMPFSSQELLDDEIPVSYGVNTTTNNMILCNRRSLPNGNGFILGKSGSGKSFSTKAEFTWMFLTDENADIIVIDPQGEYTKVAEGLNKHMHNPACSVLEVSNTSNLHFNPFEGDITQPDFIGRKASFIQVMMTEMLGNGELTPLQKSIVDQVLSMMYQDYEMRLEMKDYENLNVPTLKTFYDYLDYIDETEAEQMHKALWTYVEGSYDLFAHESNIDSDARLMVYDISQLGETIRTLGLKVVLETIRERIIHNHMNGRHTYVYVDEIYLLLKDEFSANYLYELWKWVRKFGASMTGMTQNISDLLRSQKGSAMLSNSEFYMLLQQDQIDLMQLKTLLNLSEDQVRHVVSARKGCGLLRFGNTIVPFENDFPRDTQCYAMWNTDPKKSQTTRTNEYEKKKKEAEEFMRHNKRSNIESESYGSYNYQAQNNADKPYAEF